MDKVKDLYVANKKYVVLGVTFVLGGLAASGVQVPSWVPVFLSALGLN